MAGLVKVEIVVLVVLSDLKMKMGAEASTETLAVDYESEFLPSCLDATLCVGCFCDWMSGRFSVC